MPGALPRPGDEEIAGHRIVDQPGNGLIAQGYVTKQIANLLDRSENTTKIHRFRIFNKLGVTSSAQLVKIVEMAKSARAPAD